MHVLCKMGIHSPNTDEYEIQRLDNGHRKWHYNYVICKRCSARMYRVPASQLKLYSMPRLRRWKIQIKEYWENYCE